MSRDALRCWAPRAWVRGGWRERVLLAAAADGRWAEVTPGVARAAAGRAACCAGPVLPGLVDAHSHAFQRAFAGLAERRDDGARRLLELARPHVPRGAAHHARRSCATIAAQLYVELLRGGYTQVCEFHYLHHDRRRPALRRPAGDVAGRWPMPRPRPASA